MHRNWPRLLLRPTIIPGLHGTLNLLKPLEYDFLFYIANCITQLFVVVLLEKVN